MLCGSGMSPLSVLACLGVLSSLLTGVPYPEESSSCGDVSASVGLIEPVLGLISEELPSPVKPNSLFLLPSTTCTTQLTARNTPEDVFGLFRHIRFPKGVGGRTGWTAHLRSKYCATIKIVVFKQRLKKSCN